MKKIAIAFGFGKESFDLLERLKRKKPTLITCIGEKDDVDERALYALGKLYNLKTIVLNGESFNETWSYQDNNNGTKTIIEYTNTILKKFGENNKPFDILITGRKRTDLIERIPELKPEDWPDNPPEVARKRDMDFPLWSCN